MHKLEDKLTPENFRELVTLKVRIIVKMLSELLDCSEDEALHHLYSSETYEKLSNPDTFYWNESEMALADMVLQEIESRSVVLRPAACKRKAIYNPVLGKIEIHSANAAVTAHRSVSTLKHSPGTRKLRKISPRVAEIIMEKSEAVIRSSRRSKRTARKSAGQLVSKRHRQIKYT